MIHTTPNADLTKMTTMGTPATTRSLVTVTAAADLTALRDGGLLDNAFILGGGSNVLITGDNKALTVVHPAFKTVHITEADGSDVLVKAEAGAALDDVAAQTSGMGLWGLENLSLIPGTVGGGTVQNCGAYGMELAELVDSVTVFDRRDGRFISLVAAEMDFAYRHSMLKDSSNRDRYIITDTTLRLSRTHGPRLGYKALADAIATDGEVTPMAVRRTVTAIRQSKLPDPAETGSAGSYFTNPITDEKALSDNPSLADAPAYRLGDGRVKLSAAWLIDKAGCKEMRVGDAAMWPRQPLVLVNLGNATSGDILTLENMIINRVHTTFGIRLQCEVVKI